MRQMQPVRLGIIKRYWDKYKYQKKKRESILAALQESEEYTKKVLKDEYVHFMDAIPEIKEFLAELEAKERLMPKI